MSELESVDLRGQLCPFPVVQVIDSVEKLVEGQKMSFWVDDPLAVKSIPEELEDMSVDIDIKKDKRYWVITIGKIV